MPRPKKIPSKLRNQKPQSKKNIMPIFLIIGGLLVLIAAFFAFQKKPVQYTPEVVGNPSLRVDKEKIDMGNVRLGNTVQASFEITNVGDKPLKFSKEPYVEVKQGC
ncbi:MAG: hypothetical protein CL609_15370 [Anaerolineaceae bacterium]|nr:hypothetical protein [Anaerolineaceae bacterium]